MHPVDHLAADQVGIGYDHGHIVEGLYLGSPDADALDDPRIRADLDAVPDLEGPFGKQDDPADGSCLDDDCRPKPMPTDRALATDCDVLEVETRIGKGHETRDRSADIAHPRYGSTS